MYRNTASISGNNVVLTPRTPSPSKINDDSESDTAALLEQKRRQLDEEIAQFKAAKDKEFEDFERSLKKQKQRRRRDSKGKTDSTNPGEIAQKPGALSLLAGANKNKFHANGGAIAPAKASGKAETGRHARPTPLSKATISLDRLNIKGETTPPVTGSPLPTNTLARQLSKSPQNESFAFTPPRGRSPKTARPPTPPKENDDSFTGVFTPSFLPLLESKSDRNDINSRSQEGKLQRHNSFSHSQSGGDIISPLSRSHRSQTVPMLPSTSLPSALRTASGTAVRKRKRVTFQLADSAIVKPSSSYEEMPSPEPREEDNVEVNDIWERMADGSTEKDAEEEAELGLIPPFSQKQIRSPTIKGKEHGPRSSSNDLDLSPGLDQADDGGSGVGFFELDEEIASPGFGKVQPFELDGDDVDDFNALEDGSKRKGSRDDLDLDMHARNVYEYGGSVPIDIVRPSGSWIGSFGH